MLNETDYIFPEKERKLFKIFFPVYLCLSMCVIAMFLFGYTARPNKELLVACLIIAVVLLTPGLVGLIYKKYRYSQFSFGDHFVSIQIGRKKRVIYNTDKFYVSIITMLYGRRYENIETKFIVLWKQNSPCPAEHISPYVAIRKYDIILLPFNAPTVQMLKKH